jgi:hypothetical protein
MQPFQADVILLFYIIRNRRKDIVRKFTHIRLTFRILPSKRNRLLLGRSLFDTEYRTTMKDGFDKIYSWHPDP